MNHNIDTKSYCLATLGTVKLYVDSYELSKDKRLNFQNLAQSGMYLRDNGPYPTYLKLKGIVLRSECARPGVLFHNAMNNANIVSNFSFSMDGITLTYARIKSFMTHTDTNSQYIKCEIVLCCDIAGSIKETEE